MKILIISQEVWRDDTNGGNVLSNIFDGMEAEFAQIYCSPGTPSNGICKRYYQMTDIMVINNILRKLPIGKIVKYENFPEDIQESYYMDDRNKSFYNFFRKYNFESFRIIKEVLWKFSNWKNSDLKEFIEDFNPDIIFSPCYGSHNMLAIDRYVAELTNRPVISYISDDHYSLQQFSLSPLYWLNRLILRNNLRKTFKYYDLTYTMTDEQLIECQNVFDCDMKILRKSVDLSKVPQRLQINRPIKLIYAGGIYLNRWKRLAAVAQAIEEINKDGLKMTLDIYTGNELSKKQKALLNDGENSIVHSAISQNELLKKYYESDIALHVEGLDIKNRLITRTSFSTKIVDCLTSGCATMAICWGKQAGYTYLKKENAAICIDNTADIKLKLLQIVKDPNILTEYRNRAFKCLERNHQKKHVLNQITNDFNEIMGRQIYESPAS